MTRRRIQPKAALELETVSLRLPAQLVQAVEQYAKYLGGSTAAPRAGSPSLVLTYPQNVVTAGGAQPAPPACSCNTAVIAPTLPAIPGGSLSANRP